MKFKAICFDLDGTLLNSLADIANCTNELLLKRGFPTHNINNFRYFVGNGVKNLITLSLPKEAINKKLIKEFQKDFEDKYRDNWYKTTIPYEDIPELLDELINLDIKLSILSNKPQEFTSLAVKRLLPNWQFEAVLGQLEDIPKKPSPEGFLIIKNQLQLSSKEFIFVGDTGTDMKTAVAAGCYPVGVLWGFRSEEELKDNGARKIISKPLELLEIIN